MTLVSSLSTWGSADTQGQSSWNLPKAAAARFTARALFAPL